MDGDNGTLMPADTDGFVRDTVLSCRLFTEPEEEVKYYGDRRRGEWDRDSDEITLLIQYFNNCLLSGDPADLDVARRAFLRLSEKDDDALLEVLSLVMVSRLDASELIGLMNPDGGQPEFRRYALAVACGQFQEALKGERRDAVFSALKAKFRSMMNVSDPRLHEEAIIFAEFRDQRAIPLLRRYAISLAKEAGQPGALHEILRLITDIGGNVDDIAGGDFL